MERLDSIPAVSQLDYPLMDYLSLNFPGIESIINSLILSPSPGTREINWQNPEKHFETVKCISGRFLSSVQQGCVPEVWKEEKVIPIFKSGTSGLFLIINSFL